MNTILGVFLALAVPAAPPAGLVADAAAVDRGAVKGGPLLHQTFRVTNHAAEAVTIAGLDSGCGCVKRAVSKTELKPNESADVTLAVNTLTQPAGPQTWRLTVRYRPASAAKAAPDERLELRMAATLSHELTMSPPMVSVSTEAAATATVTLTDARTPPLTVSKAVTSSPHVTATLKAGDKPGTTVVELSVSADLPPGTHDETVVLHTTDPAYAELQVPARIVKRAKHAVTAYPEALDLAGPTGVVQFRRAGAKPVSVASAACDAAGVTVTTSSGSGPVGTLKVAVPAGKGKAEVRVKFTEPAGAELVIPVRWGRLGSGRAIAPSRSRLLKPPAPSPVGRCRRRK